MQFSSAFRAAFVALFALAGAGVSSAADAGTIWISELKGGWFIGVSGGIGTLIFHGRRYPLSIGGLSAGLGWQGPPTLMTERLSRQARNRALGSALEGSRFLRTDYWFRGSRGTVRMQGPPRGLSSCPMPATSIPLNSL